MEVKVRAAYANEVPNDDPEKAVWKELFCSYFSMVAKSVETGKAQKGSCLVVTLTLSSQSIAPSN